MKFNDEIEELHAQSWIEQMRKTDEMVLMVNRVLEQMKDRVK